jgi:23S rRNA U2552 (ribose-2'-O)-methylase RlmE/FtsJ
MDPVPGAVLLYPMNFLAPKTIQKVRQCLEGRPVDTILSDMAPNLIGQREADHWKAVVSLMNI